MRDRLAELKNKTKEDEEIQIAGDTVVFEPNGSNASMAAFFTEVEDIRRTLTDTEAAIKRLADLHHTILETVQFSASSLREEAEDIEGQIRIMAIRARKQIKGLGSRLPQPPSTASSRILLVQESALGRRLQAALSALNTVQVRHREQSQVLLRAQIKVTRDSLISQGAQEEEAKRLLDLDHPNISVFTDHHLLHSHKARQELAEIQARHDELLTLERSIKNVRDLFLEISNLVESQGEMIDNIEAHVLSTADFVESGRKDLGAAEKNKISARKKKVCLIVCGITTLLIVILALILSFMYS